MEATIEITATEALILPVADALAESGAFSMLNDPVMLPLYAVAVFAAMLRVVNWWRVGRGLAPLALALAIGVVAAFAPQQAHAGSDRPAPVPAALNQTTPACQIAIEAALSKIGAAYVWGAKGPNSFDCSGLTYWAYQQAGLDIGVSTYDQIGRGINNGCILSQMQTETCWQPGDLVFLAYPGGQHVALYVGGGFVVDAYNQSTGVIVHRAWTNAFYQANFTQGRRLTPACAGGSYYSGEPTELPPGSPASIEAIADILPRVDLLLPLACGDCQPGQALLPMLDYPPPPGSGDGFGGIFLDFAQAPLWPFQWFGVFAWNELIRPLICWMIAIAQGMLNGIAIGVNVIIAGLNLLWRVAILGLLWLREMFLASWSVFSAVYLYVSTANANVFDGIFDGFNEALATIQQVISAGTLIFLATFELLIAVMSLLMSLFGMIWMIASELSIALTNLTLPAEAQSVAGSIYWQMFRDVLRGIVDSQLGWAWVATVGIVYLRFFIWLAGEFSQVNQ